MRRATSSRSRNSEEGGFALLLVLLFAAIIAINLYMEVPRLAFQAQRQKEQMLVERGEQYKRAIGLFVRANKRWPANMDELESLNGKHWLRKRYLDPMTGKDEWRLVHIANGVLTDSVTNKKKDQDQQHISKDAGIMELAGIETPDAGGQSSVNAATRRRPSDGGTQLGPDGQPVTTAGGLPPLPGSGAPVPPGVPGAAGVSGVTGSSGATGVTGVAGGGQPFPTNGVAGLLGIPTAPTGSTGATGSSAPITFGLGGGIAAVGGGPPAQSTIPGAIPGNLSSSTQGGFGGGGLMAGAPGGFATAAGAGGATGASGVNINPQAQAAASNLIQGLLTQPRPGGAQGLPQAAGGVMGSGIAGVASKAKGDSIMVYYDQTNYADWEFLYDPMKFAVPPNPNTSSAGGTPASQMGSSAAGSTPNQAGTPVANVSSPVGGAGGAGGFGASPGASGAPGAPAFGALPGAGGTAGASGATTTGGAGGASGATMPSSSSAFGQAGPPDIRPGKK